MQKNSTKKKENPFLNLIINIILPVVILNKTHLFPGEHKAITALVVGLSFPLFYGLWDLYKNSNTNYFSILGVFNTLITGLLAVFHLDGFWFAVKEAAMPAILGAGVYLSSALGKPFFKTFINMSGLLNTELINETAKELGTEAQIQKSYLKANNLFAVSFFLSAVLNFALAIYVFIPISKDLSTEESSVILNEQISKMHWLGMLAIGVPMMFFLAATIYVLFSNLQKHTGLSQEEILNEQSGGNLSEAD